MRNYMQINRLWLLGILVVALLSWWAQGYKMAVQVEGSSVLPVRVSKDKIIPIPVYDGLIFSDIAPILEINDMAAPIPIQDESSFSSVGPIQNELSSSVIAPIQESKDKSAPLPVQDELNFSGIAQILESNDMVAPIPVQDEPSFSNVGPTQEINDKAAHIPVQNELSSSDVAPIQESKDKSAPLPIQDELSLLDGIQQWPKSPRRMGPHARDHKHRHHHGKHHPPSNAPTLQPQHQEEDYPPPNAPAPAPHAGHQEEDYPPAIAPSPAPTATASSGNGSTNTTQWESRKELTLKAIKICGNVLSASPLPLPFVVYWTTGYLDSTIRFYSKWSVGSTALSSYAWLTYSILQVSYKDKEQVVGLEAIVVNSISWAVLAFMLMFLIMHEGRTRRGKRCIIGLITHALLTLVLVQFPILRLVESDSPGKLIVGIIASVLQVLSEIIPLISLWQIWSVVYPLLGHQDGPAIRNYKKMTIVARAVDCFVTLYWMQFFISTYEFDEFGVANITSAAISIMSFLAHSAWALKPCQ